jgi:hypothetical protein
VVRRLTQSSKPNAGLANGRRDGSTRLLDRHTGCLYVSIPLESVATKFIQFIWMSREQGIIAMQIFSIRGAVLCAFLLTVGGLSWATPSWAQDSAANRTFLFIGTPNSAAWKMQIASPGDREATVRGGIEKLGGKLLSYYWGLGNGKNYITVSLPDDPTFIQAFYLSRMGDGLLNDYQMIEMMSSPDMAKALTRVSEVKAVDDLK